MIIPLLVTISLCALSPIAKAMDFIPKEEKVQIKRLPNGIKTYVQEHDCPLRHGSFRIVVKKPYAEDELYRYDGMIESMESVEQFFQNCKQKAFAQFIDPLVEEGLNFIASGLPASRNPHPREVAVVAVGDFREGQMLSLIEKHFGELKLADEYLSSEELSIRIEIDPKITNVALSLGYCIESKSAQTFEDLKAIWKSILLQDLFQQRLEICSRNLNKAWVHPHPRFFYPVNGYSLVPQEISENMLTYLLFQDETLRKEGFFEEEFQRVKFRALGQLHYLASSAGSPDDAFLASYFADQFLLGGSCPCAKEFMNASLEVVTGIQWQDVLEDKGPFLLEKNRYIQVTYPLQHSEMLTEAHIEQIVQEIGSLTSSVAGQLLPGGESAVWLASKLEAKREIGREFSLARCEDEKIGGQFLNHDTSNFIFQIDDMPEGTEPFYQLPIADKEKRIIKTIITTMAEKNILQLALIKRTMEKKGKKIEHVHPMRFIGYVLSNAELRSCLRTIKKSSFKWDAFIDGFSGRMKEEFANNNLYIHVPGFSHQIGANAEDVILLIQKKDWEGLVKNFM